MSGAKPVSSPVRKLLEKERAKAEKKAQENARKLAEKEEKRREYIAEIERRAHNAGISMSKIKIPERKVSITKVIETARKKLNKNSKKVTNATKKTSYIRRVLQRAVELGVPQNKIRGIRYFKDRNASAHAHSLHRRYTVRHGEKQTQRQRHISAVRRIAQAEGVSLSKLPKVLPLTKAPEEIVRVVKARLSAQRRKRGNIEARKTKRATNAAQKIQNRMSAKNRIMEQTGLSEEQLKKIVCARSK